jgi:hypothetical protein
MHIGKLALAGQANITQTKPQNKSTEMKNAGK